ncbi:response regulator [Sphingomonas parva]|uniref:Response regulator n=1 Tax=Sphingomonas parva TaxID=2555898 RepID=A0A4Y8ZW25_9SPHN|nr:response regulator [Sphingomonas parva]TFI60114.1 response regulator [Sphingomonas parva]
MTTNPAAGVAGARVLVLEDDYYLATDLQEALEQAGATVLGPCSTATDALRLIEEKRPDCALLDVNLGQGPSFDLPKELSRLGVPFAFVTGYEGNVIPEAYAQTERLEKPVGPGQVVSTTSRLLTGAGA